MGYVINALEDKSDEALLEYFIYPVWVFIDGLNFDHYNLHSSYYDCTRTLKYSSRIHQLKPSDDTSLGSTTLMYMTTLTDAYTFFATKEDALNEVSHILLKMSINNSYKDSVKHRDDILSNAQNVDIDHSQTSTCNTSLPEISW